MNQVIVAFLEECPRLIKTMQSAMPAGLWKDFQRAAHTLKSGLRMFGVQLLADEVEGLELCAKSEQPLPDPATFELVTRRCRRIFDEMAASLQSSSSIGSID